jgi:hypothetical protein|tara:strand:- start:422 stop:745 length:324 start_codon:yes stop_codon:yes gene_type:complete
MSALEFGELNETTGNNMWKFKSFEKFTELTEWLARPEREGNNMWKLMYAVDSLDPDPMVKRFEEFTELTEWLGEEISRRVQRRVDHSSEDLSDFRDAEAALVCIDEA